MPKKFYISMPKGYAACLHSHCTLAATCLHQLAYNQLIQGETYLNVINPTQCSQKEDCPFYRNNQPVVYARGFTKMQKRMLPDQYRKFMQILIGEFGSNPYYERRRGETALSPREQEIVRHALRQVGLPDNWEFDAYEENVNWLDY